MSDGHDSKNFNAEKIFTILFVFTAIEIGWGYFGDYIGMGRFWLWSVLSLCAAVKFVYILNYFMHFKYELMIVKSMVYFTPFLILVIFLNTRPDVAANSYVDHPNGTMLNTRTQTVEEHMDNQDEWLDAWVEEHGAGH